MVVVDWAVVVALLRVVEVEVVVVDLLLFGSLSSLASSLSSLLLFATPWTWAGAGGKTGTTPITDGSEAAVVGAAAAEGAVRGVGIAMMAGVRLNALTNLLSAPTL